MKEIRTHTAMRGIAATMVVFFHYRINLPDALKPDSYTMLIGSASVFVDLFFILSGFVLCYTSWRPDTRFLSGEWIASFLRKRIARIYPLHVLTLGAMLLLAGYSGTFFDSSMLRRTLENLFLIHAWGLQSKFIFNFPSWSISGEWAAYLLFPLFAGILMRRWFPVLCILVVTACYMAYWAIDTRGTIALERVELLRAIPAFALGMLLYRLRDTVSILSPVTLAMLQVAAAGALLLGLHFGIEKGLFIPVMAILVLSTWQDRGPLVRVLDTRLFRWLGVVSYSIYMLHIPVRAYGYYIWPKIMGGLPLEFSELLFVVACFVTTLVAAHLVYRFFEIPARRYLRHPTLS